MSIRIGRDEFLTLSEAAKRLPAKNSGRRLHVAALYRWASNGCRGVVLETIHVGGQRYTSMDALQRFLDEVTQRARASGAPRRSVDVRARRAEIERTEAGVNELLGGASQRNDVSEPSAAGRK